MDIEKLHAAAKELANNIQTSEHSLPLLPEGFVHGTPTKEQVLKALERLERHQRSTPNLRVRAVQQMPSLEF